MIRRYLSVRRQAPISNVLSPGFVELSLKLSSFLTPSPQVPVPQLNRCSDTLDFFSVATISLPAITWVMSQFDITSGFRILVFFDSRGGVRTTHVPLPVVPLGHPRPRPYPYPTPWAAQSYSLDVNFFPGFDQPRRRPVAFAVGTWDEISPSCGCRSFVCR